MLKKLRANFELPGLAAPVQDWLRYCQDDSQQFWDCTQPAPDVTWTECEFEPVARTLAAYQSRMRYGVFVEWGCGLAAITGVASLLGLKAFGFEIDPGLCRRARQRLMQAGLEATVLEENFLPSGARELATPQDPVVSLKHSLVERSSRSQQVLDAAGMVFVYSWPGEEHFLKLVFDRFSRVGTLLMLYRGPEQLEVFRKH